MRHQPPCPGKAAATVKLANVPLMQVLAGWRYAARYEFLRLRVVKRRPSRRCPAGARNRLVCAQSFRVSDQEGIPRLITQRSGSTPPAGGQSIRPACRDSHSLVPSDCRNRWASTKKCVGQVCPMLCPPAAFRPQLREHLPKDVRNEWISLSRFHAVTDKRQSPGCHIDFSPESCQTSGWSAIIAEVSSGRWNYYLIFSGSHLPC
jgi:hypothetical protein